MDVLNLPWGSVKRVRAKRFKEALQRFIKILWTQPSKPRNYKDLTKDQDIKDLTYINTIQVQEVYKIE